MNKQNKKMKEIYLEIYHKQNISGFIGRVGLVHKNIHH